MKRPRFDLSKLMDMHGEGSAKVIMQRIEKVDFYFYFFSNEKTALQNLILHNMTLFLETFSDGRFLPSLLPSFSYWPPEDSSSSVLDGFTQTKSIAGFYVISW